MAVPGGQLIRGSPVTRSIARGLLAFMVILSIMTVHCGCGYTRFAARDVQRDRARPELRPDLALGEITTSLHRSRPMDSPREELSVTFEVQVINVGHAPFNGTVFFSVTADPDHSQPRIYGHAGSVTRCSLAPNQYIVLKGSEGCPLDQQLVLYKVTVLTDRSTSGHEPYNYRYGLYPVEEERYDNNERVIEVRLDPNNHE